VTSGRRAAVAAVTLAVAAVLIGGGLVLLLRGGDNGTATPSGAFATALAGARPASAPFAGLTEVRLDVGGDCHRIVLADDVDERSTGLMGRRDLGRYSGMLFVFDGPSSSAFTMSDVPVPLDIGFYDAAGRPIDRLEMRPCPDRSPAECPVYLANGPYRYALETLGGQLSSGALSSCS